MPDESPKLCISGRSGVSPSMMVSRGAELGTMKPEALSDEGGLLLVPLLAKSIAAAQRLGDSIRAEACATHSAMPWLAPVGMKVC